MSVDIHTPIPLARGTRVRRDDTDYRAIAIVHVRLNENDAFVKGAVLVINRHGETLTLPLEEVEFVS